MDESLLGLLGLARRGGKLALGEEEAASAALAHKARLTLIAGDAADGTAEKARRAAEEGNSPCFQAPLTKAQLGSATGRASCAVLAVTDVGLAAAAIQKLAQADPERYSAAAEALSQKAAKTVRRRREKQRRKRAEEARGRKPWAGPPRQK